MNTAQRAHWGSRLAFILAAAGSAVGLGNIWKFPYIAGVNGGGSFVFIYLICIAVVGVPILIAELYIGQQAQKNTVEAFEATYKKQTWWRLPGWLGVGSAFLILSFYSVVGGWILDFLFYSLSGHFVGAPEETIKTALNNLFASPLRQALWHTLFMGLSIGIVFMGVNKGLERWAKILMPSLFAILGVLLIYCFTLEGFPKAVDFLFSLHSGELKAAGILEAVGHSFFTLSLGMGAMITYGSYLKKDESLIKIGFLLALLDTLVALSAGLVIFSIVFTFDLEPGAGPKLIFSTLPVLFSKIPGGYFISIIFFLLVAFAAITSAVSILEVAVAYWTEKRGTERKKTSLSLGFIIYALGFLTVFSTNILGDFKILGLTFFDFFDKATSSYMLPIGGLLISLFLGWKLGRPAMAKLMPNSTIGQNGLLFLVRFVAPLAILLVLYNIIAPLLGLKGIH